MKVVRHLRPDAPSSTIRPSLVTATELAPIDEGYRCMDAYSPFPIEELHHALGSRAHDGCR